MQRLVKKGPQYNPLVVEDVDCDVFAPKYDLLPCG